MFFFFYFILTLLVYFLGLFLFVPRHQNSTKMEVEKIVQEKTEMQRHYVMVSTGQNSVHQMLILYCVAFGNGFCMRNIVIVVVARKHIFLLYINIIHNVDAYLLKIKYNVLSKRK